MVFIEKAEAYVVSFEGVVVGHIILSDGKWVASYELMCQPAFILNEALKKVRAMNGEV